MKEMQKANLQAEPQNMTRSMRRKAQATATVAQTREATSSTSKGVKAEEIEPKIS